MVSPSQPFKTTIKCHRGTPAKQITLVDFKNMFFAQQQKCLFTTTNKQTKTKQTNKRGGGGGRRKRKGSRRRRRRKVYQLWHRYMRMNTLYLREAKTFLYVHNHTFGLKPVLNWANVFSPNILRTVRRTMIRFLIELLVRRTWFGQSKLYFVLNWLAVRCKLRPELAADAQQTT